MNSLPQVDLSFGELYETLVAPLKENLMLAAIELGVFDHIVEPRSSEAIANTLGIPAASLHFFLDGLTACDLLAKKDGQYRNTPVSQTFLVKNSPAYLGRFLSSYSRYLHSADKQLSYMISHAKKVPPRQPDQATSAKQEPDTEDIAGYQRAGAARLLAGIVSQLPGFQTIRRMLDLGGGPGLIGITIVQSHPNMKGVIFDMPGVAETAGDNIKEYGMNDRLAIMIGDFDRDPIGSGYDLVLASAVFHISRDMDLLVGKIHAALNPGGLLVSFHEGLTDERTKPAIHVLGCLPMAMKGQNIGLEKGAVANSMGKAGFETVESRTLTTPVGPMELDIARKEGS